VSDDEINNMHKEATQRATKPEALPAGLEPLKKRGYKG
jgi:hypothetical protein